MISARLLPPLLSPRHTKLSYCCAQRKVPEHPEGAARVRRGRRAALEVIVFTVPKSLYFAGAGAAARRMQTINSDDIRPPVLASLRPAGNCSVWRHWWRRRHPRARRLCGPNAIFQSALWTCSGAAGPPRDVPVFPSCRLCSDSESSGHVHGDGPLRSFPFRRFPLPNPNPGRPTIAKIHRVRVMVRVRDRVMVFMGRLGFSS